MAVYRIGDILRMKREALGITREKLCEMSGEICSVQTLYRMECGKVKVKPDIYRKLMLCMGQLPERNYASIKVSNYQALNLKTEIQAHLAREEYEQAEKKLEELEQFMDTDYVRNKQFLLEMKVYLAYKKNEISSEVYLEKMMAALSYTIPKIEKEKKWPYNTEEISMLWNIADAYHDMKMKSHEEDLLKKICRIGRLEYMEKIYAISCEINGLLGLSMLMSLCKKNDEAIKYCEEGIETCKSNRLLGRVYDMLYDEVWNRAQVKNEKKERENLKNLLVQAYYLSIAQNDINHTERIKRLIEKIN